MQSGGPKTVKDVLCQIANNEELLWFEEDIGYLVNSGNWSLTGLKPNGGGFGGKKGEIYKTGLNKKLGADIVKKHKNSTIKLKEPWGEFGRKSEFLGAVKNVCARCDQQVTVTMQNDLRVSKPVYCNGCGVQLFGPGE